MKIFESKVEFNRNYNVSFGPLFITQILSEFIGYKINIKVRYLNWSELVDTFLVRDKLNISYVFSPDNLWRFQC